MDPKTKVQMVKYRGGPRWSLGAKILVFKSMLNKIRSKLTGCYYNNKLIYAQIGNKLASIFWTIQ